MKKVDALLEERLETLIQSMGWALAGLELLHMGRQMVFRLYIDSPESDPSKGVTADACSQISRQVGAMMDVEELFPGRYTLEVSSPGIHRPLFKLAHFEKQVGQRIKFKLYTPLNERRQFSGLLRQIEGEVLTILLDDTEQVINVSFSDIEKANLIGEIRFK